MDFLASNTNKSGELTESLEVIRAGFLSKGETAGNTEEWFPWVFSTIDCDRYDERVDPAGWELDAYRKNAVVLWAHDHSIPAIGIADDITVTDTLSGRIKFNDREYDPFGWGIGERVRKGVIRAGSVSFRILKVEFIDHQKDPDETCDLIFRKQELLEFSICNVPANPFALRKDSLEESGDTAPTGISIPKNIRSGFAPFLSKQVNGGIDGRRTASRT